MPTIADVKKYAKALADDNSRYYGKWNSSTGNGKFNVPAGMESYPPTFDCGLACTWAIYKALGWNWNNGSNCAYKGYIYPDNEGNSNHEWFMVKLLGATRYRYSDIGYAGLKDGDVLDSQSHIWMMYDKANNLIFEANDGYSSDRSKQIDIHPWINYGAVWVYRLPWTSSKKDGLQDSAEADGRWAYYKDEQVDTSFTGLAQNKNGWFYVKEGFVDFTFTEFCENDWGIWWVVKGKIDFSHSDVVHGTINGEKAWYLIEGNKFIKKNTVAHNSNGWWKITDGKVDFNFNGIAQNQNGIWYIRNGKVDFSVDGTQKIDCTFQGGKLIL